MGTAQTKGTESRWVTWAKEGLSQEELEKKREEEVQKRMALRGAPTQWICPPAEIRPEGTVIVDPVRAVQTPFTLENKTPVTAGLEPSSTISGAKLLQQLTIKMRAHTCPRISEEDPGVDTQFDGIACCLKEVGGRRWFRNSDGRDIQKRVEIQQTLAVDWSVKHYHSPDVLLPTTFYDLPHELVSEDIFIQFEDYKYLGAPLVEEEIDFWAWMYVWGRFAFLGLLDWQRNYNTKPKDLAHASEQLTYATARAWRVYPSYRTYIRNTLSTLGRGGAQGQAIRDRILDVMHKHKIPETAGHFYEQWHQKLHNNTTPDDVGIC
ncbi:alpha-glucan water dikinase, partial [Cystoisospora suis]